MKNYTMFEMTETGLYDEKAIAKFYNKQLKLNNGNAKVAASMVNIYKHNFKIRTKKPL